MLYNVKNPEMKKSTWILQVGPKRHLKCPCKKGGKEGAWVAPSSTQLFFLAQVTILGS